MDYDVDGTTSVALLYRNLSEHTIFHTIYLTALKKDMELVILGLIMQK